MVRLLRTGLVLSALLVATREASGQAPCASTQAESPEDVVGQQAFREGRYDLAAAHFEAAYRTCPWSRTEARLATTHIAAGRWEDAYTWMHRVFARREDVWVADHREDLEQQRELIMQHVGELVVTGTGGAGEVLVNGRRVADFPMTEPVGIEPGEVLVRVRVAGRQAPERREQILVGRSTRVVVELQSAPPPERNTLRLVLGGTSAGFAAVGLGVGIWASVAGDDRRSTYDQDCPNGHYPSSRVGECDAMLEEVVNAQRVQVAGFVAAGAFALTSAVLFAMLPSRAQPGRAFVCGPSPGVVGIGCVMRF